MNALEIARLSVKSIIVCDNYVMVMHRVQHEVSVFDENTEFPTIEDLRIRTRLLLTTPLLGLLIVEYVLNHSMVHAATDEGG